MRRGHGVGWGRRKRRRRARRAKLRRVILGLPKVVGRLSLGFDRFTVSCRLAADSFRRMAEAYRVPREPLGTNDEDGRETQV